MKTSELIGEALDWAVREIEGNIWGYFAPSTDWAHGGPIIEREKINLVLLPEPNYTSNKEWNYWVASVVTHSVTGPTLLIAAMRCYVASKLGDEVDIPTELIK